LPRAALCHRYGGGDLDAYSLFDTVGFRAAELRQQQGIAGALQAGGVALQATPPVYETGTIRGGRPAARAAAAERARWRRAVVAGQAAPAAPRHRRHARQRRRRAGLAQFLRYTWGGHPLVLAMLAGGKRFQPTSPCIIRMWPAVSRAASA
jgi:hypothetical protein